MPNSEIAFHVHKTATQQGTFVFTIGVWEVTSKGSHLRAICHIAPIQQALVAIGDELRKHETVRVPARIKSAAAASKSRIRLRKLKTTMGGLIHVIGRIAARFPHWFRKANERSVSSTRRASPPA